MNKVLFVCILMIGFYTGQAQAVKTSKVPSVVTAALKTNYPYATNIEWEMLDGTYEASFLNNKSEMAVIFSNQGVVALTETPIEVSSLPKGVMEYFEKIMIMPKISEASKLVDAQGIVSYEVEVNKTDYLFTTNGQFLRKEAE